MNTYLSVYVVIFVLIITTLSNCNSYTNLQQSDLSKGNWALIASDNGTDPAGRSEAAFIEVGDKMYLLGGRGIQPVSIYDPENNNWKTGSSAPIGLHHFQPVIYKGEIYVVGAMTGDYPEELPVEDIYVYNPEKDAWRTEGKIPSDRARGSAGIVIDKDMLYIVCGIRDGHRGDHKKWLDRYNLKTKEWTQLPDAPLARDHFQAAIVNGKIYALAGRTTISADNPFKHTIGTVDVYDVDNGHWSTLPEDLPTWRAGSFVMVMGDELIVIGGESFTQEKAHSEVEALNVITKKWRSLPSLPIGRHGTGIVNYKDALYTASGVGNRGGGPILSDLWKFEY